jgi:hypothetical protein
MKHMAHLLALVALLAFVTGCGTVHHNLTLAPGYEPAAGTTVKVGTVKDSSVTKADVDTAAMFREALTEALQKQRMHGAGTAQLVANGEIVDYSKGNAFKRWLMPGWGATTLSVRCSFSDGGKEVATAEAKRAVAGGGLASVGAWKKVFDSVANDIVEDLKKQMPQ